MLYPGISTRFGFGCMRLKTDEHGQVVYDEFKKMIDLFMESGFTYFDTAHPYLEGQSERALCECLVKRYPRSSFTITDKLSSGDWEKHDQIRNLFESQLNILGTDYIDLYLLHAMNRHLFEKYQREDALGVIKELKKEGKIKHVGMSFHDSPEVLDMILNTIGDDIEVVQLQINYLDMDNPMVRAKECYDVCVKHHKPIIVMEPIKGGTLVNLPNEAEEKIRKLNISPAELALRYVANLPQVIMTLSGMGTVEMMKENISFMKDIKPLTPEEEKTVEEVVAILKTKDTIPCTSCHYCTKGCPMQIKIPEMFEIYNKDIVYHLYSAKENYSKLALDSTLASRCIQCGQCESVCPQKIKIIDELINIANKYEKN